MGLFGGGGGGLGGIVGGLAGGAGGFMLGGPIGALAGYTIGSGLGSALEGPPQVGGYYSDASGAQLAAAQLAAEEARFRPVGISTRFGTSTFGMDEKGRLASAGYKLSGEAKSLQDYAMAQAQAGQADTSRLLSLGRQYIAQSPEEASQQYMLQQRALLQPGLEQQYGKIKSGLLQTGRGGLAIGQGGYLSAANPELQAYYNAVAQQEAALAAQAEQEGRARTTYGQSLLSSAYTPISTPLGLASTIETLGQTPLDLGAQLGGRAAQAGANAGQFLYKGGLESAQTSLAGNIAQAGINAQRYSGLQNSLGNVFSLGALSGGAGGGAGAGLGQWFGNLLGNPMTAMKYGTNIGSEQTRMLAAQDF